MNKKLRKDVLAVLSKKERAVYLLSVCESLATEYNHQRVGDFDKNVRDILRMFGNADLVVIREFESSQGVEATRDMLAPGGTVATTVSTYMLSKKGWENFDPWYVKSWRFFNDDFAKILSLVATVLSIIATYISITT